MKALFCPWCNDVVVLRNHGWRSCECGVCRGRYVTRTPLVGESDATVEGDHVQVIGIANDDFDKAFLNAATWPRIDGLGPYSDYDYDLIELRFKAWFFGPNALHHTKTTKSPDK